MLKGQAKTDYQKEYMRKRRSNGADVRPVLRAVPKPVRSNGNVRPNVLDPIVRPKKAALQSIIDSIQSKESQVSTVPLYNPSVHKAGDRVLVSSPYNRKLIETVIPELDAGGQPMPEW